MRPAGPSPREGELSEIIDATIQQTEIIVSRCRVKKQKKPTDRLSPAEVVRCKTRLQELVEDPIVNSDATDILIKPHSHLNGVSELCSDDHDVDDARRRSVPVQRDCSDVRHAGTDIESSS